MLSILRGLFFDIRDDDRNTYATDEEIERQFLQAVQNEVGLPPIVGEAFLKALGYTYNNRDLAVLWRVIKDKLYVKGKGWKQMQDDEKERLFKEIVREFRAGL